MNVNDGKINGIGRILEFCTPKGRRGTVRIESALGEGSASRVFAGRATLDTRQQLDVAVKVLRPELAGTAMAERFARESLLLCSLSHPSIVRGLARGTAGGAAGGVVGSAAGLPFLVMERVRGISLLDAMRRGGISPETSIGVAIGIASALEHIRLDGRVLAHRDIKPANIMLLPDGSPKLMDLGVARTMVQVGGVLETRVAGTLHYMAPEQIADSRRADTRSDLFSLGLVLFEMLGGTLGDDERNVLARRMAGELLQLGDQVREKLRDSLGDGGASALEAILLKMCAFEPEERYQTPRQVAFDLSAALDGRLAAQRPAATPADATFSSKEGLARPCAREGKVSGTAALSHKEHRPSSAAPPRTCRRSKVAKRVAFVALLAVLATAAAFFTTQAPDSSSDSQSAPIQRTAPPEGTDIVIPVGS